MRKTQSKQTPNSPRIHFNSGAILANVPGILGYYPNESFVFACIEHDETSSAQQQFKLGPILRIDIKDANALDSVGQAINSIPHSLVLMYIITTDETAARTHAHTYVKQLTANHPIPIIGCWWTSKLLTGQPYTLLHSPHADNQHIFKEQPNWDEGTISTIITSPTTQELIKAEGPPHLTREEAHNFHSQPNKLLPLNTYLDIHTQCQTQSDTLANAINNPTNAHSMHTILGDLITHYQANKHKTLDELLNDKEELIFFGSYFSINILRDAILLISLKQPQFVKTISQALFTTFKDTIKANALCAYALACVGTPMSYRVMPSLTQAQKTIPGHLLSKLLVQSYSHAGMVPLLGRIYEGAIEGMKEAGGETAPFISWLMDLEDDGSREPIELGARYQQGA